VHVPKYNRIQTRMNIKTNTHHHSPNGGPLAELQPSGRTGQTETPQHRNTEAPTCFEASPTVGRFDIGDSLATAQSLVAPDRSDGGNHQLSTINHPSSVALLAKEDQQTLAVIETKPLAVAAPHHKARRKGRVACLPKLQRDLVNRMLSNGVPYKNIVAALGEACFSVSERNISSWATGGYLEWRFEQDLVLQNRLDQDHLVDHLRRDDASELPEVGLQAAATRISQVLLQKTARAEDIEANLGTFSQMVDVLCRLNREIGILQKQREDSRRTLGPAFDAARIREEEQTAAHKTERYYSDPEDDSGLEKPASPALLPPFPTSSTLAVKDLEDSIRKQRQRNQEFQALMQSLNEKKDATPTGQNGSHS